MLDDITEANLRALSWMEGSRARKREFHRRESVYVIAAGDFECDGTPVKIGYTALQPKSRLAAIQAGHYATLSLVCAVPGGRVLEESLHETLADDRIRGEWFRSSRELRKAVAMLVNTNVRMGEVL